MRFEARELPAGLSLDAATGRIDGCVARAGEYRATLLARNELGTTERELRIVIGDKICLTPPLGWNSWNCWARSVDDARIRASARALAQSDLINHGWSYINIDDTWQGVRGGLANALQPNAKFPDMKGLVDFIHALGLKAGIYSTPWMVSYGRHLGGSADIAGFTYQEPPSDAEWQAERWNYHKIGKIHYDQADAAQWADWGFDYLKYDWFANDLDSTERMSRALAATGRDIVYSLSNRAAYAHAARYAELANLWRTTRDIVDVWPCLKEIGFNEMKWRDHQGPGHWNDPDMLVVGNIGWSDRLRPTRLTPDEQYTHISLWCLLAAPLLIGCPLDQLDDFTLSLLTNDEVLDVDQDPLGAQGMPVSFDAPRIVYVKPLEDGSFAMGLFNTGHAPERVVATWPALGLAGPHRVRDLWRQTDLGVFDCAFEADVPRHGVVLVRVFRAENG
jgi:alpha-galactosidase